MTLYCGNCGSAALEITSQNYSEKCAFEAYECENCGGTGSLTFNEQSPGGASLTGCLEGGS